MGLECYGAACGCCSAGEDFIPECLDRLEQTISEEIVLRVSADHALDKFYVSLLPHEAKCKSEFDCPEKAVSYLDSMPILKNRPELERAKAFIASSWETMQDRLKDKTS